MNSRCLEYVIEEVEIEKIIPDKNQPRKYYDLVKLRELANSIESIGLINPPVAEKINDKYRLVVGHRRWLAALIAGLDTIKIKRINKLTPLQRLEMQIHEDSQEAFLPWIRANNYYKLWNLLKKKGKITLREYCKGIGKNETTVRDAFNYVTNLTEEIKELVVKGSFDYSKAKEIAKIKVPLSQIKKLGIIVESNSLYTLRKIIKKLEKSDRKEDKEKAEQLRKLTEIVKYEQLRVAQWLFKKRVSMKDLEKRILAANPVSYTHLTLPTKA